jgi:hypothetical protein
VKEFTDSVFERSSTLIYSLKTRHSQTKFYRLGPTYIKKGRKITYKEVQVIGAVSIFC